MPTATEAPPTAPSAAPPTPTPRQPPELKPPPQPSGKSAREVHTEALSSWMSDLGTLDPGTEETSPPPPEKPAPAAKPAPEKPAAAAAANPERPTPDGAPPGDAGEDKWPRSSEDWKRFIAVRNENYKKRDERIKALEADLKAREERLAAFKDAVDPKEHESVRSERDKLSETLRLAAVEKHPKFVAYYENKTGAQVELARRIVGAEKADAIATLLKGPDSEWRTQQIEALMTDLTPMAQSRLGSVINSLEELRAEREGEISRAREDYEKASAKAQAEAKANGERARSEAEGLFSRVVKDAQAENPIFQPREGDETWNKGVQARIEAARSLMFNQHKPDELAKAALHAAAYGPLLESYNDLLSELAKVRSQVEQLSQATPGVSRRESEKNGQQTRPSPKQGSRPMEAIGDWMRLINEPGE